MLTDFVRKNDKNNYLGKMVEWTENFILYQGKIVQVVTQGKLPIPDSGKNLSIIGTDLNPALKIQIGKLQNDLIILDDVYAVKKLSSISFISTKRYSYIKSASSVTHVNSKITNIVSTKDDEQIIYGVVYAPYEVDSDGDMMLPNDLKMMAENFISQSDSHNVIDTNHDNIPNGSYPIESFIARAGDPDYPEGAWVLGVKVTDPKIWKMIKQGKLNGYSVQILAKKIPLNVELQIQPQRVGLTESCFDHTHLFFVEVNEQGKVIGGITDHVNGHHHTIITGTKTEQALNHCHRYIL